MVKKSLPTHTQRVRKQSIERPIVFEKIEIEAIKKEQKVILLWKKVRHDISQILSSPNTITRGDFVKFFVAPFFISCLIFSVFLLTMVSRDPLRIPSLKVTRSIHSFSDIIKAPAKIFSKKMALQGQEVFDPYQLKLDLDKGVMEYVLIDIRSKDEYDGEHIRDAYNLSVYGHFSDLKSLTLSERDIMAQLKKIVPAKKPLVLYGHTRDSQLTKDVAAVIERNGWEVGTLGVGWNEWRHFTNLWLPEPAWSSTIIVHYLDGNKVNK